MAGAPSPDGGLSREEAARRLAADGPNSLPPARRTHPLVALLGQFVHFFAVMLWVASGLALAAGLPQLSIAIVGVVVLNGVFSFAQQRRSDRAAERLGQLLPRGVTVRRDGVVVVVDASEVVRGDRLLLAAGDRVPADATVERAAGASLDTSMLTGESVPEPAAEGTGVFAGTFVVTGELEATVTATGSGTRLAGIAALTLGTVKPDSPLEIELHRLVRTVSAIAVGVGVLFASVAALVGMDMSEAAVFAIGVTVALVPEGLLPTVTLSLAIGAQRMADRNALVRRLDAVETLGSTTFICTDKTGTLTRNEMTVVEVWTPAGSALIDGKGYGPEAEVTWNGPVGGPVAAVLRAAVRSSAGRAVLRDGGWVAQGDPMEAAMEAAARRIGLDPDADRAEVGERWRSPFDPVTRHSAALLTDGLLTVKGAAETLLDRCDLDDAAHGEVMAALDRLARAGGRVIAVADRAGSDGSTEVPAGGLRLAGLISLADPPREQVPAALAACRTAGIKVLMMTGDHPVTAGAIARQIGLATDGAHVITGAELPADEHQLGALIDRDGTVIARVSPEDKLRIARALRARGHVVAMTGDGVNDGPALHEADIGVAMGRSGTDVARESADLILLDDDFATIVGAIAYGRATFFNVRRFLTYHLTDNVAELTPYVVWALSGGRIPLALTVMQILALDLGTDTASASALGAEVPAPHVLEQPPVRGRLLDRQVALRAFGLLGPIEAAWAMLAFFTVYLIDGWRPGDPFAGGATLAGASGAAYLTVVIAQTANAWACRSTTRTPWQLGWASNRLLIATASAELAFALGTVAIGPVARELEHTWPPASVWPVIAASVVVMLSADAIWKHLRRRTGSESPDLVG